MKKWNSLPEDIKKLINDVVTPETQKWTNKQVLLDEAQSLIELKTRKMVFVDPDPGTIEDCSQRVKFLFDLYEKKFGKEGYEIVNTAKEMMAK
jgi:TRAP-type C4-dicarboxylate transport system substrate-binding protein